MKITVGEIVAIITAAAALVAAVTGLIHSVRTRSALTAPRNEPARLPGCDTERSDPRDVPLGFAPPESRAR